MKAGGKRPNLLNVDVLALSLLCCLLASIVGLVVLSGQTERFMLGSYKGSYVLIECLEGGAIIYPGGTRIEMNPPKEQLTRLVDQIAKAGFVAFAVRPSGWYNNSYDKLKAVLYPELDRVVKESGRSIGRNAFPLDSADDIRVYLPPRRDV